MTKDNLYIRRCFDLARLGNGAVSPNPMVGAVLVYDDQIIGEGYHQEYGKAHAEVNALNSVLPQNRHLIPKSTLYVSLEPCCIFGRTPPCTNLIINEKIPRVVVSTIDHTASVKGQGLAILRNHGVEVVEQVLEEEGKELAIIRNTFTSRERPFVLLKFAQSQDHYLAPQGTKPYWLTNQYSRSLVHKWRSEYDAIMVGYRTALLDNPALNNRLYFGNSPLRILIDKNLQLPKHLKLFDQSEPTLVVNSQLDKKEGNILFLKLDFSKDILPALMEHLRQSKISSLMVEGGAHLLNSFIQAQLWDEARVFTASKQLQSGLPAPKVPGKMIKSLKLDKDQLTVYKPY